jgi:hypothetical protein
MKLRLLALLAGGCLLLSLVACGGSSSSSDSGVDTNTATSSEDSSEPAGLLNDTGQDQYLYYNTDSSDYDFSYDEPDDYPGQDAYYGRDAYATTKTGGGSAGFDFTKLDAAGNVLDEDATVDDGLACVRDNHTGMVWEVKIDDDSSVRDMNYIFTQPYKDDSEISDLIAELNGAGLCGYSDWRLPEREELRSIVDYGSYSPAIDTAYFPNTQNGYYWAVEASAASAGYAWGVYFGNGGIDHVYGSGIDYNVRARLVRADAVMAADLTDNGDGTISDAATGLIWKKCTEGQSYDPDANTCTGTIDTFTWQEALQRAVSVNAGSGENLGRDDWRLPNIKELASIVDLTLYDPAIDTDFFPETASSYYWSSTPYAASAGKAWGVSFGSGVDSYGGIDNGLRARLVRAGQ